MKKFVLAIAFASALTASAIAQTSGLAPRDPPFGKGDAGNDTMHEASSAGSARYSASNQSIPPRDPPFGKGDAGNDTSRLPSSATTRGMASDGAKPKKAMNRSAMKKDRDATSKDTAPKTDTD